MILDSVYSLIKQKMKLNNNWLIATLLTVAFLIRLFPIDFPFFSVDEARIAFRGYILATMNKDELGRPNPLLFNSLTDYQLPAVSYITALGILALGKSDLGARIPFIFIGVGLVLLTYKSAQVFSQKKIFWIISALLVTFSPALIFLSKIPNESIVLAFMIALLFYLLVGNKPNLIVILGLVVLFLLVSKFAWFVIAPFVVFTLLFYQNNLSARTKINFSILCFLLSLVAIGLFLYVPQAKRSLMENNFPLFSDITIRNGIDKLRGQGLEIGWPPTVEKVFFNKSYFLIAGVLSWLSYLNPSILFSQADNLGLYGFLGMGLWPKMAIIPAILGLVLIIKKGAFKDKILLGYLFVLTFPLMFIYPNYDKSMLAVTLPFMSVVLAFGLVRMNSLLRSVVVGLMIFEVGINLLNLTPDINNAQNERPTRIKQIVLEAYKLSLVDNVAVSDNIASDVGPFLQWYTPISPQSGFLDIQFPYRFRQTKISNIKIIGSDNKFYNCGQDIPTHIIASERDLKKIQNDIRVSPKKIYKDSFGSDVVFLLPPTICVN